MSYMGHLGSVPDLNTLSNVSITSPDQDQVLAFNNITKRWENKNFDAISVAIDELQDVEISSPISQQVIMYDGTKWSNQPANRADRRYQFFFASF